MTMNNTVFTEWQSAIIPSSHILRDLAGKTEEEFLQIGGKMQEFFIRSSGLSQLANSLVQSVSGTEAIELIERLQQMLNSMESYLEAAQTQSDASCNSLEIVLSHLEKITEPLEGFQKLTKTLRMLGISTKIESARMGEAGLGFVTLAQDVEKLSHQVNEKSSNILKHRQALVATISNNLRTVRQQEHNSVVSQSLFKITENLQQFIALNQRCGALGELVSSISTDVAGNMSEVVSSMQMHDMTRQQVEHIIEALEKLVKELDSVVDENDSGTAALIIEVGDVCELQEAQLRFATSELCGAAELIIENLRDVAEKQARMAAEVVTVTGSDDGHGESFIDAMKTGMERVTAVLRECADADSKISQILSNVAATLKEVTGFVSDIEEIGSEIELIALNSQVKAALTGEEGAALGVLAEAVKRLSDDAITQTDAVSRSLKEINDATENLFQEATSETAAIQEKIQTIDWELSVIMTNIGRINSEMNSTLTKLTGEVYTLSSDIDSTTSSFTVGQRVRDMAEQVMVDLHSIVDAARQIEPASNEFKNNLKFMEERYTMESERHIHEAISRKRAGGTAVVKKVETVSSADSEFGDNVDLF